MFLLGCGLAACCHGSVHAWDYYGHRIINQLAVDGLPVDAPAFLRTAVVRERIAFLAGEPDRWRSVGDLPIKHYNSLDHYLDVEHLAAAGLDARNLPTMRYIFAVDFAAGRAAHRENFAPIDPERNLDGTREWAGFLPWAIAEYYGKLKSAFSYLRTFEDFGGTPEEITNAQENIIYVMGVMGHYVGDGAQPLHTTKHYNGWVGPNPAGFTTWRRFHSWIDGGFVAKAGINQADLQVRIRKAHILFGPSGEGSRDPAFVAAMDYLLRQFERVEPLYELDRDKMLSADESIPVHAEGVAFIEEQLLRAGEMLGSLWLTAWRSATVDFYLQSRLAKRQAAATAP